MVRVGLLVVAISAVVVLSGMADAKPWIRGVGELPNQRLAFDQHLNFRNVLKCRIWDIGLPRKVDPDNPVEAHDSDCKIYYIFNYPMTCGDELVFNPVKLACMAPADVAEDRPECAA